MGKGMYYLLKILLSSKEEYMTAEEILNQLKIYDISIGIKGFYGLIKQLNAFFEPIYHDDIIVSSHRLGYCINKEFFDDGQLQLLIDSITYHMDLDKDDKDQLIDKLLVLSSYHQRNRIVQVENTDKKLTFSLFLNLNTIMKAIDEKKAIAFEYISYEYVNHHFIEISKRKPLYKLSPYRMILNNNHYYVLGYNKIRKDELSIYRVDRMRQIQTMLKGYKDISEQYDLEEKIKKMMNMFVNSEMIDLTLLFHKSIVREIISRFGLDIIVEEKKLDWYQTTIYDIELSDGLIGWLMMLQSHIKVIAPYSLKEEMHKRILSMEQLYQD